MNVLLNVLAFAISFIICVVLCPICIPILHKMKFGQQVRTEGPEAHIKKQGTPTMGGVMIVLAMFVGTIVFVGQDVMLIPVVLVTLLFALIGCLDDYLKIAKHQSEGLKAWQKMGFQFIVTIAITLFIAFGTEMGTTTIVPFFGVVDLHGWFFPIAIVAILGTVNGANFTDGVDGLASGVTIVIAAFLTTATLMIEAGLTPSTLAMIGALMAFLCFNCHPAKVFMGDTGSLALGGYVAVMAFMLRIPIFLIFIAFIYLVEIISVMLQVGYFKLTHGKRIFRMTPIHHHYELGGWSETKVVTVFSVVTVITCLIAFVGLFTAIY